MRITKETLESLANKGIVVSPFPTEESKEQWKSRELSRLEDSYRYETYRSEFINGRWIRTGEVERENWQEKIKELLAKNLETTFAWHGLWYDSENVYIRKDDMIFKRKVNKSTIIEEDFVLKVIDKESKAYSGAYGEFARQINKMFSKNFGDAGFIYPTTYGIGVWVFYNFKKDECIKKVENILNELGVEYRNEFSDARWVYRFVISKKYVNRMKL